MDPKKINFAVIHTDSGAELSYHETAQAANEAIDIYETIDRREGTYAPEQYDVKPVGEDDYPNDMGRPRRHLIPLRSHEAITEAAWRKAPILRILHRGDDGSCRAVLFPDGNTPSGFTTEAATYDDLAEALGRCYDIECPEFDDLTFLVSCGNGFAYAEVVTEEPS